MEGLMDQYTGTALAQSLIGGQCYTNQYTEAALAQNLIGRQC